MLFTLVAVFSLSIDIIIVEGGNTVYPNSEIANLTITINKLLTQFTHKCPITEQSNSCDTINDLMQLVLTNNYYQLIPPLHALPLNLIHATMKEYNKLLKCLKTALQHKLDRFQ